MRVALLGRSQVLLEAGQQLVERGHAVTTVGTCKSESYYTAHEADFEAFAKRHKAAYFCHPRINDDATVALLKQSGAEIGVSWNWLTVIGAGPIGAIKNGILNGHAGDLPRYRGNACPNWAILNGEKRIGCCVHQMVPGELDSGDIVRRAYFDMTADTYIGEVYAWIEKTMPGLFADSVDAIASGRADWSPQSKNPSHWLRCYPRRPEDGRIDWKASTETIYRLIRASSHPFAGAFSALEGERHVTIWRAQPVKHTGPFLAVPGQILAGFEGDPLVATGDGVLRLTEVAMDGADDRTTKSVLLKSLRQRLR